MKILVIPEVIYLYDEATSGINFKEITYFVHRHFGPIPVEVVKLKQKLVKTKGIIFDFLKTIDAFEMLPTSRIPRSCHIVFTEKIFATLGEDNHVHLRTSIYSYPTVISLAGIVEAPAKPREYYLYKQFYSRFGIWEREQVAVKARFQNHFLDYHDKRMNEVLKGFVAQALFFYITAVPFCERENCRLFNAHRQEDLIYAQVKEGKFCYQHRLFLAKLRKRVGKFFLQKRY